MKIADEFMVMRRNSHLTQTELAKVLGVSHNTIGNWERDSTPIPAWAWVKVQELSKHSQTLGK